MLMNRPIFSDDKEYISAIRAAEKIGYASDYIGQLCRAKKISGRLIGKTWYVDFASLLDYKKNRQFGKVKKSLISESKDLAEKSQTLNTDSQGPTLRSETLENSNDRLQHDENSPASLPIALPQPSSETTAGEARSFNNPVFTYEKDDKPRLPELSKKSRYVEPIWNARILKEFTALSLALLVSISAGFATLQHTNPSVATEVRESLENISNAGKKFLTSIPANLVQGEQLVATSIFSNIDKFFDDVVIGFRNLKDIALKKTFFASAPLKMAETFTPPQITQTIAVTESSKFLNLESLKSELKTELESYVRAQIYTASPRFGGTNSPVVVYSSGPVINQMALREEVLLTDTRPTVTRQSSSDVDKYSSRLARLSDGGTFTNPTLTGATISGPTGSFSNLIFDLATGTSATTTNLFSTTATFTNLYGTALGFTDIIFTNATGTSATTTNFFSTTASSTNLFSSLLTVGGNALVVDSSGNVGIGTTTPTWLLNPTSATASQLALSSGAGFSQWAFR